MARSGSPCTMGVHPRDIWGSRRPLSPHLVPPGRYLLMPEEEATLCSSRNRTSRACCGGSPGERSSEPLLDEGCGAGTREGKGMGFVLTPRGFAGF